MSLFRALVWLVRLLWRATATRSYPYGAPFYLQDPEIIDGRTIRAGGRLIRISGLSEKSASAIIPLRKNLRWRKIFVIPVGFAEDGVALADLHCGRGSIAQNMIKQGHK